ncbi:MAG: universal stress protein [Verrucomicrobiota bacterium]
MYKKILITLENGPADETILPHIAKLAAHFGSEILLVHVADGFAARCFDQLKLAESEEMKEDRAYLERTAAGLRAQKLSVETELAMGNPPAEILRIAAAEHCDLIAMTSHGHRFFGDLFHGSTITQVRHHTNIPLLVLRAKKI